MFLILLISQTQFHILDLALKIGIEGLIKMVEEFDYDKRTGVDLPNEKISR